jgi:hypothetical protein
VGEAWDDAQFVFQKEAGREVMMDVKNKVMSRVIIKPDAVIHNVDFDGVVIDLGLVSEDDEVTFYGCRFRRCYFLTDKDFKAEVNGIPGTMTDFMEDANKKAGKL